MVVFTGKRSDVPRLISAFDVFVLPSLSEGVSLTLIEAMAGFKPVIATDVGGNPEVVSNGVTGILVPPKDEQTLVDAILRLAGDEKLCNLFGKNGNKKACEMFDIVKMADQYDSIYQN